MLHRVSVREFAEKLDATQFKYQSVTRALRIVPDMQYDTAHEPPMKSHPGFQQGNFLHALASSGLAAPSSVLVLAHMVNYEGANQDISCM